MQIKSDFIIIGSGIAGLSLAIQLAKHGKVSIITKAETWSSNTWLAQGGIASVINNDDSFKQHVEDTLIAGAGLCKIEAVKLMVEDGPKVIDQLLHWGVDFSKDQFGNLELAKEGGHKKHRIVHALDSTGKEIERALIEAVKFNANIQIFTNHSAVELITNHHIKNSPNKIKSCYGVYAFDSVNNLTKTFIATETILCSGGAGQVYLHTTNPEIATGDGIAMAYRAGCEVENLEFMQFHPTSLYQANKHKGDQAFLISEAVRGFGAILCHESGHAFMEAYHPLADLAPRDIVARAIDSEMKKNNLTHVYLDLRHKEKDEIIKHFPSIYQKCLENKIDISKELIPVVPAAHYMCGGIKINLNGQTNLKHLFACGEVSSSGVHGANRLASNSLLEAVVFANKIAQFITQNISTDSLPEIPEWDTSGTINHKEWGIIAHDRLLIRQIMWDNVGIVRSTFRLTRALNRVQLISNDIELFYKKTRIFAELIELRNLALLAQLIIKSALERKESRGLHYSIDFPNLETNSVKNTVLIKQV
jgi:L-aspartate oxidase